MRFLRYKNFKCVQDFMDTLYYLFENKTHSENYAEFHTNTLISTDY